MRGAWPFAWGAAIGTLGGLIGLGGAEFRLPVLVGFFRLRSLNAVLVNLVVSLVTVTFSLVFRLGLRSFDQLAPHTPIILNILAGSLIGSYTGAHLATRINERILNRAIVVCLVCLSAVLIAHDAIFQVGSVPTISPARIVAGFAAGLVIGIFSSILGVAGGELIIPTLMLLFGVEIKLAGSLSLAISIPTIGVGLLRYSRKPGFAAVHPQVALVAWMACGSLVGALIGSQLAQYAPGSLLRIFLGIILLMSAIRLSGLKVASATQYAIRTIRCFVCPSTHRGPIVSARLGIGPILLLGIGLRFHQLAGQSLWSDEGNSVALARAGLGDIAARTALDIHPPLYYWLLHGWMRLVGDSEVSVRALSALASLLLVAVIYRLGSRLFGERAGLVAAFVAAVSPFQVYYAQEARMYALLALLGGLTVWAAAEMAAPSSTPWRSWQRLRWMLLYVLSAALGLYTHYAFPVIMVACTAAGLTHACEKPVSSKKTGFGSLLCQVLPLALFAAWLPIAWRQLTSWPTPAAPRLEDSLLTIWRTLTMGPAGGQAESVWLIALGLLWLVGLARLLLRGSPSIVVLVLLYLGLPVALTAALFKPAYLKFLLVASPAWCLFIAVAIAGYAARHRSPAFRLGQVVWLLAGCILLAAAAWSPLHTYYSDPHAARDDYRGIARYLAAVGGPQDAILLNAPGQQEVFGYYYRGVAPVYPLPRSRPLDAEATLAEMASILAKSHTIYAVYWATDESDRQGVIEGWLEDRAFKAAESWVGNLRLATYAAPLPEGDWTPAGLRFADRVTLSRYQVSYPSTPRGQATSEPGDIVQVQLLWQTDAPLDVAAHTMVFLQALDAANHLVGQRDAPLSRPGADWLAGQPRLNRLGLLIAPGTPPGEHRIIAGLYDAATGVRLPVQSAHADSVSDSATLGTFVVERPAAPPPLAAFRLRHPTDTALGPLRLLGYDCYPLGHDSDSEAPLPPGAPLRIVLTWQAAGSLDQDWRVNLRLVSSAGASPIVAEGVYPAAGVDYALTRWQPGEVVRAQYDLFVPASATPGAYSMQLRLVDANGLTGPSGLTLCPVRVE